MDAVSVVMIVIKAIFSKSIAKEECLYFEADSTNYSDIYINITFQSLTLKLPVPQASSC